MKLLKSIKLKHYSYLALCFIFSLILHIMPLAVIILLGATLPKHKEANRSPAHSEASKEDRLIDKTYNTTEVSVIKVPGNTTRRVRHGKDKCKDYYGGIGVMLSYQGSDRWLISHLAKGYPADLAGIKENDTILRDSASEDIRGTAGTVVHITFENQDGVIKVLDLVRDKICVEKTKN